ncbi:Putative DNA-binding domain-containing protein [Burkholderia sp. WP9]|nr:ATP-binding protein [Burkholderia sp. WP9]SEF13838.1 Putative DNA-binding domain-containing protein [Burkholderia sp. WP9]
MIPHARLDAVTEADLQTLIDHGVRESRTLDYKRDWPADRDARTELAKDVCAFANTMGGDLVFGMREEGGAAAAIVPLPSSEAKVIAPPETQPLEFSASAARPRPDSVPTSRKRKLESSEY